MTFSAPFDNSYARLPGSMHAGANPTAVEAPRLIKVNIGLAEELGIEARLGQSVIGVRGRHGVTAIEIARNDGGATSTLACDAVLMAGGWTPTVHLWSHSKGTLAWRDDLGAFVPLQRV